MVLQYRGIHVNRQVYKIASLTLAHHIPQLINAAVPSEMPDSLDNAEHTTRLVSAERTRTLSTTPIILINNSAERTIEPYERKCCSIIAPMSISHDTYTATHRCDCCESHRSMHACCTELYNTILCSVSRDPSPTAMSQVVPMSSGTEL
jgi:hypothetical protein